MQKRTEGGSPLNCRILRITVRPSGMSPSLNSGVSLAIWAESLHRKELGMEKNSVRRTHSPASYLTACSRLEVATSLIYCCCCVYSFWVGNPTDSQSTPRVPTRVEKNIFLCWYYCGPGQSTKTITISMKAPSGEIPSTRKPIHRHDCFDDVSMVVLLKVITVVHVSVEQTNKQKKKTAVAEGVSTLQERTMQLFFDGKHSTHTPRQHQLRSEVSVCVSGWDAQFYTHGKWVKCTCVTDWYMASCRLYVIF